MDVLSREDFRSRSSSISVIYYAQVFQFKLSLSLPGWFYCRPSKTASVGHFFSELQRFAMFSARFIADASLDHIREFKI